MRTSDFSYHLPPELIAQTPAEPRDHSRLMVLDRGSSLIRHHYFYEIIVYLRPGDVLVFNDSRVIPARLYCRKLDSGGKVEILLLRKLGDGLWEALAKPGKRLSVGAKVLVDGDGGVTAEVVRVDEGGVRVINFSDETRLKELGKIPLPPYIHRPLPDPERYQTVYARIPGSVAAPTAGLHFTLELIEKIGGKGVDCLFVTLHVGLDSFRPVKEDDPLKHPINREYGILSPEVANRLSQAKGEGRRVICVGTTTVRLLEAAAKVSKTSVVEPFDGWVDLFILPGHQFKLVDGMITNFHLPRSTLLMLVCAFAGRDFVDRAYQEAVSQGYRFYSFGDAMLIL